MKLESGWFIDAESLEEILHLHGLRARVVSDGATKYTKQWQ
jgi:hypothetical protein